MTVLKRENIPSIHEIFETFSNASLSFGEIQIHSSKNAIRVNFYGTNPSLSAHETMQMEYAKRELTFLTSCLKKHLKGVLNASSSLRLRVYQGHFNILMEGAIFGFFVEDSVQNFFSLTKTVSWMEKLIEFYQQFPDTDTQKGWHFGGRDQKIYASTVERAVLKRLVIVNPTLPTKSCNLIKYLDNRLTPFSTLTYFIKKKPTTIPCPRADDILRDLLKDRK